MLNKTQPDNISIYIGSLLKCYRKSVGMTGAELGLRLNMSQQQISRYERGKNELTINGLMEFLLALDLKVYDIDYFMKCILKFYQKNNEYDSLVLEDIHFSKRNNFHSIKLST